MTFKNIYSLLKETFDEWKKDKVGRLAAAMSYYTVFALAPLLLIVTGIIGLVYQDGSGNAMFLAQIKGLVGETGATFFEQAIQSSTTQEKGVVATIIGLATMLLGATGLVVQLKDALNTVWGITEERFKGVSGLLKVRAVSLAGVVSLGFLLLVSLIMSTALSAFMNYAQRFLGDTAILVEILNQLLSLAVISVVFALLFKFLPDVQISWRDVWPGAVFTAVLFTIGKFLIGLYLGNSTIGDTYGAAGSVMVVLLWVFYSTQILLFGAEFTQVYSQKHGSKPKCGKNKAFMETFAALGEELENPPAVVVEDAAEAQARHVLAIFAVGLVTAITLLLNIVAGLFRRRS